MFRTKHLANGSVERRKSCLVAKGFHQQHDLEYTETFNPVVRPSTIRLVLFLAVKVGWHLYQLDIQNTFLHSDLFEEVFMQ